MAITVEAIYEDGVLKPQEPLPFKEHEKVNVTVEERGPSLAERIVARARALPPETLIAFPPTELRSTITTFMARRNDRSDGAWRPSATAAIRLKVSCVSLSSRNWTSRLGLVFQFLA